MSQNCKKLGSKSGAKIVNATFTMASSYLHPLSFGMQMWHLPSLPPSLFTFLRRICKQQIFTNPYFFLSSVDLLGLTCLSRLRWWAGLIFSSPCGHQCSLSDAI